MKSVLTRKSEAIKETDEIFQSDVEHVMSSMGEDGFIVSKKEAETAVNRSAKKELQRITE